MGARVSLAEDQTPLGHSAAEVLKRDESGREVRHWVRGPDPTVLQIVHFVDLEYGRRVTTERFGAMSLEISPDCSEEELRREVVEFIFEDEMREIPGDSEEPLWGDMLEALGREGVSADEKSLGELPFIVELDEQVLALLRA
jgi:hypothetical protein